MRRIVPWITALVALTTTASTSGCGGGSTASALARAERAPELRLAASARAVVERREPPPDAPSERREPAPDAPPPAPRLSEPVDLRTLERELLARHPELIAAAHRVRALAAAARAEGSLPEPVLMAQLWQVPLERPYALGDAGMLMVGVEQRFPAPGALGMREEARAHEALAELASLRARARDLVRELDVAFVDYLEATARHELHLAHRELLQRTLTVAAARSAAGAPATDAAQATLELARVDADVAFDHATVAAARARINGLLLRRPGAPLGPPVPSPPPTSRARLADLVARARASRPEIAAAEERRAAAEKMSSASEREASIPSFGLGLNYFAPVGEVGQHGYGVNVSASLPWLWGPRRADAEARVWDARSAAADVRAVEATIDADVATADATLEAAEQRLTTLREMARPAARRAVAVAEAGYASGQVDLLRILAAAEAAIAVELAIVSAEAARERAIADLDRAVGASSSTPLATEPPR